MFQKISQFTKQTANFLNLKRKSYSYTLHSSVPLTDVAYSKTGYLKADKISLYFNKTTDKRAEKVGQIQFTLTKNDKPVEDSDLLDLLNNPNPLHPADKFWALWQKYYDVTGEAYLLKKMSKAISSESDKLFDDKKVNELWLIPSDKINPIIDNEKGIVTGYLYKPGNGDEITYSADEIIYSFKPDPTNLFHGESIARSGLKTIESENQIGEYHSRVLSNGGKVEGIFTFEDSLNETQYNEMKDNYEKKYSKAQKSGMPMFLGGSAKYQNIGLSPDELSFLETKGVLLDDILIMTGVPKSVLGSMSNLKFSNAEESYKIFLRETIKPLLDNMVDTLNRDSLTPEDETLSYIDPTPADVDANLKKAENGIKYKYMTINEARELNGLDHIEGGDELPTDTIQPIPETKIIINNKGEEQNKSFHPLREKSVRYDYGLKKDAELMSDEDEFEKIVRKYFNGQSDRLVDTLTPLKHFKKKDLLSETFNTTLEVKIAEETFLPALETLMLKYGQQAVDLAGGTDKFTITGEIASFLDKKVRVFSEQINDTTFQKLKEEFAESFELGETRKELISRIQRTYGNINETRAKTIARTEVHATSQYSTLKGYESAGLETKIWVTVGIGVRDLHQIDGEEVPMNQVFSNGLKYPGDPSGSAGNVINCRCVI